MSVKTNFKVGDRVRILGKGVTNGKTGTVVKICETFGDHTIRFDVPTISGKKIQTYANRSSLEKIINSEKPKQNKKVAVFISECDEIFMKDNFETLDEALKRAEEETDGDPDFSPVSVIWDGVEYNIRTEIKLIAE